MKVLMGWLPRHDLWAAGFWLKAFVMAAALSAAGLVYERHGGFALGALLFGLLAWVALSPRASIDIEARRHDNVIDFAHQFDVRVVNVWVIRSTYEQFQLWLGFPVRVTDRLSEDLHLSAEDLDDVLNHILRKAGRRMLEEHKLEAKTIRELVFFINILPKA